MSALHTRAALAAPTMLVLCAALALLHGCDAPSTPSAPPRELTPTPNLFGAGEPLWSPQPHRDRPSAIAASADGRTLWVTLAGTESDFGRDLAEVDAATLATRQRIRVGPGPVALALHPDGRHLLVANRYAAYASLVDTREGRVVAEVPCPYYTEGVAFSPDGRRAYFTNRWKDALLVGDVRLGAAFAIVPRAILRQPDEPIGTPIATNPRRVSVAPDGSRVLVTSETGLTLTVLDADGALVGTYSPNAPVLDAAIVGDFIVLLHTGQGTNHPPDTGFDGDHDGAPGDGTANVNFQDLQNEIDVLALDDLRRVQRYTSDTICCKDFRDVDPDHPEAGLALPAPDPWPPSRLAFLPTREAWIVGGALPERVVRITRTDGRPAIAVVFSGSGEVQTFDIDVASGALTPRETQATGLYRTGFGSTDAAALDGGRALVVVDSLGETLTKLDLAAPASAQRVEHTPVGDVSGGAFPATDAELGEVFNAMTARLTVDGDQTCVHCHRDGAPVAKAVAMPLLTDPENGVRLVMSYRGGYDSRPWFVEAAMTEENFFPVLNEFARKENFCCEQLDTRVWSRYPARAACTADATLAGCNHVLRCADDPPPECATRTYGAAALTREQHFLDGARRLVGRDTSFGDGLWAERLAPDGTIVHEPISLSFDGITRALGLFLLTAPRLPPNPNAAWPSADVRVGRELYASSATGCATCHPLPVTATAMPTLMTSADGPLRLPNVVTPMRHPETHADVDRLTPGFLGTFPLAVQTDTGLRVGVPVLRGAWDRGLFLHHGQARSLREVVATPGHRALLAGERGFNERDGQPDTHGGTSQLSPRELDALVAYLLSL